MSTILIPLATGFEELEAVSLIDVLRRAEITVIVAGVQELRIKGAHNILIETEMLVSEIDSDEIDMILLPGGWDGTYALAKDKDVQRLLKEMSLKHKLIGAMCAAPYALHAAGVLSVNYTCYPSVEEEIRQDGYISDRNVVIDDNVMTSRGPGTALEFALEIVEKFKGKEISSAIKEGMLIQT